MECRLPSATGLVIGAANSASGKSVLTLALLRAFRNAGRHVVSAKSGPDFLDPTFHAAATGRAAINLDAWAMEADDLRARAAGVAAGSDLLLIEGAMGLLDGAADFRRAEGVGSSADLAAALGLPVLLVLDIAKQARTAAAFPLGLKALRPDLPIAGAILNRVGSERHAGMAQRALEEAGIRVFGAVPRSKALETPSRHLGLEPATERADLETFLEGAAELVAERVDMRALAGAAGPLRPTDQAPKRAAPLGARIAIASDQAFSFAYPHLLSDWRAQGAELSFFSPLEDQEPQLDCDAVFLPGGYPELHAPQLAAAARFRAGLSRSAERGALIYGECGGYMALGQGLIDAQGACWAMAGLLPHATSFAERRLQLGYRRLEPLAGTPLREVFGEGPLAGHEFHYSTQSEAPKRALFAAKDASGGSLGDIGAVQGSVCGSYAHLICA